MGQRLRIMAVTAAVSIFVLLATTAWMLHDSRVAARNQAKQLANNLVLTIGRNITRNIDLYDAALRTAEANLEHAGTAGGSYERQQANLFDSTYSAQGFGPVIVTDSAGTIVFDAGALRPRHVSFAGMDWFENLRDQATSGITLSVMRGGKLSGRDGLRVSRRIGNPDGSFGGIVVGAIYTDYFTHLFAGVGLNPDDIVALRTLDGHMIARRPSLASVMARDVPNADVLRRAREHPNGTFEDVSGVDGVRRLNAYARLENDLVLEVGLSMPTIYGEWQDKAIVIGAILAGFIAITLALLYGMRQDLRRRQRLETMLRDRETSFRLLTEQSSDMVTRICKDGRQHYVSPAARRVVGWSPDALTGRDPLEIVHTDDHAAVAAAFRRLAAGEEEVTLDYRVIREDGGENYVEMAGQALRDPATRAQDGCVVVTRDVTERRAAEERLRASEARFRLLAEHATDMVSRVGRDGRRHYVSPASIDILGLSPEALIAHGIDSIILPDDRNKLADLQRRLFAGAETTPVSFRVLHPERGLVWAEVTAGTILDPVTGKPDGYVSVTRDISRHKQAQAAMSEANRWLTLSEQVARLGHWRFEPASGQMHFSAESYRIYGLDPEGPPPTIDQAIQACAPEDQSALHDAVSRAVADHAGFNLVIRLARPNGDIRHVDVRAVVQTSSEPAIVTLFGVFLDVTDQVLAAEALREHAERERRAIEQTNLELERAARHLARARDDAERANQAKSRFLAGMSHELRTPLNGILGYAQLLELEGGLNPAQAERVRAMLQAGQHLQAMINQVLNLAEVDTGSAELRLLVVDLADVARTCLDLVHPTAASKNLRLDCHIDADVPATLTTDPTRLRQILLNLLGNAVKFTAHGSVALHIARTADGGKLRLRIIDTGPGIAPDKRRRLFHEFDRLETDSTVEGAGLGLALSARLAELLGGQIGFDDNPHGGSIFWLDIPSTPVAEQSHARQGPIVEQPPARASFHVLVVDDVAMNRDIASSFLRAGGHHVTCATSGEEAIEAAAETAFDVILMDVRMPGMDGLEATRHIRAAQGATASRSAASPIIALTAQAFAEQVADCRAAGMDDHLAKPFTADALIAIVQRAAATRWPRPASAPGSPPALPEARQPAQPTTAMQQPDDLLPLIDMPVIDMAILDALAALLPDGAVRPFMASLSAQCDALTKTLEAPVSSQAASDDLAARAHSLAGSAGLLGFRQVSEVARRFEHALLHDPKLADTLRPRLAAALQASRDILPSLAAPARDAELVD